MPKNLRPSQSFQYYNAAYVAYAEGKTKLGDYYWLIYCDLCARDYDENGNPKYRQKTARQEEQSNLFRKLGMISREMANIRMLQNIVYYSPTLAALNNAFFHLDLEYRRVQKQMANIKERIPEQKRIEQMEAAMQERFQ